MKRLFIFGRPKRIKDPPLHVHVSAFRPDIEFVKSLLAAGEDVNKRNALGSTPLMLAAASGHAEIVDLLLRSGAEINIVDENGQTALILALARGNSEVANLLVSVPGIDVNSKTTQGMTALMYAVDLGDVTLARRILEMGADLDVTNSWKQTPMKIGVKKGDEAMIALLRSFL